MTALFDVGTRFWVPTKDGDAAALAMYRRHYSRRVYKDGRRPRLFVGPGEKMVLLSYDQQGLFVWRKFVDDSGQQGVNCAVFRNEGAERSSDMIREADDLAWRRWPGERLYTYVDGAQIRSSNPGFCFLIAGWRRCGRTKGGLYILEMRHEWSLVEQCKSAGVPVFVKQDSGPRPGQQGRIPDEMWLKEWPR